MRMWVDDRFGMPQKGTLRRPEMKDSNLTPGRHADSVQLIKNLIHPVLARLTRHVRRLEFIGCSFGQQSDD